MICAVVKAKRALYGFFAMIFDVAALTMKYGTFAFVEIEAIAIAFGVYDAPISKST